ncbi:CapA family protein [Bacteroides sp. 224]|uniref:CapA family protein n=1 Tax=Bacteroides sp. 224 TaxID=2302936 RepID=UPI0013D1BA09|nr:CapA family protein [Bacteroides sp. 224]
MRRFTFLAFILLSLSCVNKGRAEDTITKEKPDSIISSKITLLFVGDLMQHKAQINTARTANGNYDYAECFSHIREEISKADIAIGNLEVTLGGKPYSGYPCFSAPDDFLFAIKETGFDVLLTGNNHCLDKGKRGLERTILMLDSLQIPYAGTYIDSVARAQRYPLLIEKNGFRLSIINYTYDTNGLRPTHPNIVNYIDKEVIAADIEAAKAQQPDAIIACMHWGYEYKSLPNKDQTSLTDWLFAQGVDHIIGSHPHVVQPLELRTDTITNKKNVVVYSLGNFISNMSVRKTNGGIMFKMELTKDSLTHITDCGYSLVWVAPPSIKRKKHTLIPINYPTDSLSINEQSKMDIFVKDTRKLFETNNKGINEYTFY